MKNSAIVIGAVILSGCAGVTMQDCQTMNWRGLGLESAEKGKRFSSSIEAYNKSCAQFDIKPDVKEFEAGYNEGLESYCTNSNGYDVGLENTKYLKICPPNLEPDFMKGYKAGKAEYRQNEVLKKQKYNKRISG